MARALKVVGSDPPPRRSRVALIALTTFCNARCPFCCVLDVLNRPELNPSDEQILRKIEEARAEGCTTLGFTGGEPTVHPRFAEFCRFGRNLGYEAVTINTNGIKFKSRAWVEEALAAGLSHIDFSIHGDTADLHDAMMARPGAFAAFLKGMEHLRELAPKHGAVLGATSVVTAKNAARLPAIASMLIDEGIRALRFKHCFEGGEGADADLVARYTALMGPVREAVRLVRGRGATVTVTHFPLCLLGEEAVFATDFTDENVLSIDRDGSVLIDGRASTRRREGTSRCDDCALAPACTRLDRRYIDAYGEGELRPVADRRALADFLQAGLARHPGEPMRSNVRRFLAATAAMHAHSEDIVVPPPLSPDLTPPSPLSLSGEGGEEAERPGDVRADRYVDPVMLDLARRARRTPTPAEAAVWELVRDRRLLGLKFRREQVIDGVRADFYCPALRLALEVDGGVHDDPAQRAYDEARTQTLRAFDIRVVRVRNEDVSAAALRELLTPFIQSLSSPPSPDRERGDGGVRSYPKERPMNAGFISPTFRVLEVNWEHDYEMVKLGVPTIMGHFYRLGHRDIEHWDFDAQICEACAENPDAFDLRQYFDQNLVRGFLQGTDDSLRAQTEKLLDTLGVREKAIFGISLSAVLDRIANVMALAAVGQCLAKVLKERHPRCTVIFGGIQASPDSTHPRLYQQLMEECAAIDYAFVGQAEAALVQLYRNIWNGAPAKNRQLSPRVLYRDEDGSVKFSEAPADGIDSYDADLRTLSGLRKGLAVHTNLGAAAVLGDSCETDAPKQNGVVPAASLLRERTHVPAPAGSRAGDFNLVDLDAREAGAHEWEKIPAAVPVFDKNLVDQFRYSGLQIMKRFHFNRDLMLKFSRFENDRIVVLPHIFVRGCNAPCGFCTYAYTKIEGEDVAETVAGLKFLSETYNCRHFHFLNTQINSVYRYCEAFCEQLIENNLNILWSDCANMRALDEALLEKMRRAGAMRLVFGVEAPEDSMLRMIHKGITVEKIERLLKASHDLGIWNHVLLIAGMPHETKAKQDRMMEFLERTAPTVDFYSVSSYYLIANSPWGKEPEKYGIERISTPDGYLEEQSFNELKTTRWESDGLKWPEKKQQIIESTQRFYKTISRAKGQSRCVAGNIDLYMLMYLYSTLGHDQKAEIVRIYTETAKEIFPGNHVGDVSPRSAPAEEKLPERNRFRVLIPHVVGRVNEGDQSALIQVPVDFTVSLKSEGRAHFAATDRYTLAWQSPALSGADDRLTRNEAMIVKESVPALVHGLLRVIVPFLQAMDRKLAPATAERMAELAAINLPRYKPFANEGYQAVGPTTKRTIIERNLEWSGLS